VVVYVRETRKPTLRDRRDVPESSSKTPSAAGPQAHSRVLACLPNDQIASRFIEWMVLPALFAWDNLDLSARDRRISEVLG
jgi:hypothetical protein